MGEPITCDFELSKKFYDMGIRIDSYWSWKWEHRKSKISLSPTDSYGLTPRKIVCPAPMLHELLDVIPEHIKFDGKKNDTWKLRLSFGIYEFRYNMTHEIFNSPNPANAVAKTLIWLVENNYVEVKNGRIISI
jgi:hypothetical protein